MDLTVTSRNYLNWEVRKLPSLEVVTFSIFEEQKQSQTYEDSGEVFSRQKEQIFRGDYKSSEMVQAELCLIILTFSDSQFTEDTSKA